MDDPLLEGRMNMTSQLMIKITIVLKSDVDTYDL